MALEVIKRPSKDMPDGFESRWNGSRTPLNYTFKSDLFPVNEIDFIGGPTGITNTVNGCDLFFTPNTFQALQVAKGDYVKIDQTGTSLDGGVHKIVSVFKTSTASSNNAFKLSVSFTGNFTGAGNGTVQKYYKGYKALVNVYVGAPSYHPYYDDGSKPEYLASQIQVDFGSDNEGVANVRQLVKPDLNSKFDEENTNSHYAWTSFFIEFAETWDNKTDPIVFTPDILPNCLPFDDFSNNNFINGGDDWLSRDSGQFSSVTWVFDPSGVAIADLNFTQFSDVLYQDIPIYPGTEYKFTFDLSYFSAKKFYIFATIENDTSGYVGFNETNNNNTVEISFFSPKFSPSIGFYVQKIDNSVGSLLVNSVNIEVQGEGSPCDYSSFALFGSKQFQDPIGGNFGDYVLRPFGTNEAPKMLNNFESIEFFPNEKVVPFGLTDLTYYQDFSNYVCGIIPASTFSQSEDGDNVFLEINQSNGVNSIIDYRKKVDNKSDGVYVVDFKDEDLYLFPSDSLESYCQFIIIPSNMLADGDNGTYDNQTPSTWNMSPISTSAVVNYDSAIIDNLKTASISVSIDLVNNTIYDLISFDSEISTIIGRDYIIESEFYIRSNTFDPRIGGKVGAFLGVEGIDPSNTIFNTSFFPDYDTENEYVKSVITTTFTATQTTHKVILKLESNIDLNGSGGTFFLDNTTFQGPIDYISEKKPIKVNTDCFGYKGVELRWLNTLGGWEFWKFKQYQDVKEKFKKTEIKSDIFTDYDDYFINGQSQYKAISVDSRKSVTVRSGLLTEDQLKNVGALQRSIEIQYKTELGKWQTCSIKSGSFTSLEEKNNIREISFDIELVDTLTQEL